MYERNAIVLERYFNQMFGYNLKNNIKANFKDYCELIGCLEKYKQISEEEENIAGEYDLIASKITEIQKNQEILNKKNEKLQQLRGEIFQNIDDNSENIQRKIYDLNSNIHNIDEEIKDNAEKFVDYVGKFNEKTLIRTKCERSMRTIETEYNKKLNEMLDNYKDIDIVIEKKAKSFIDAETKEIENELKNKIIKNGEKEKIPFSMEVVDKAIALCIQIQKDESRIFVNIYDKSNKLFNEIKNNTVKIDKHNKTIKDSKSELEFLGAMKEYLVQFLDNERLTAVNGKRDHNNLMQEACNNLEKDLSQINNLYMLLKKEINNKANKKSYTDLYNIGYLKELEKIAEEFDLQIKKLNLPVTIINPNYWRIEGMKKIYDVFNNCVSSNYERDIFEFIPREEKEIIDDKQDIELNKNYSIETNKNINNYKTNNEKDKDVDTKSEIDKKIDLILGFKESKEIEEDVEDEDVEDEDVEDENDVEDYWFNDTNKDDNENDYNEDDSDEDDWNFNNDNESSDEWNDDIETEDNNDDWSDDEFGDDWENSENIIEKNNGIIENDEDEADDETEIIEYDNWDDEDDSTILEFEDEDKIQEETTKKMKNNKKKNKIEEDDVITDETYSKTDKKKGKHTKRGGFFSKFKK